MWSPISLNIFGRFQPLSASFRRGSSVKTNHSYGVCSLSAHMSLNCTTSSSHQNPMRSPRAKVMSFQVGARQQRQQKSNLLGRTTRTAGREASKCTTNCRGVTIHAQDNQTWLKQSAEQFLFRVQLDSDFIPVVGMIQSMWKCLPDWAQKK